MAGIDSSVLHSPTPTHQGFRWLDGPAGECAYAVFLGMTYDLAAGIHTCLEIIHASDLQREANHAADEGEAAAPAIGAFDAEKLMRLSIASSALLTQEAMRRIEVENADVAA